MCTLKMVRDIIYIYAMVNLQLMEVPSCADEDDDDVPNAIYIPNWRGIAAWPRAGNDGLRSDAAIESGSIRMVFMRAQQAPHHG